MIKQQDPTQNEQIDETASLLAHELGETEKKSKSGIYRIVKILGIDTALELLQQAREAHEQGGMQVLDGTRQRTLGGIWFRLSKARMTSRQRYQLTNSGKKKPRPEQAKVSNETTEPPRRQKTVSPFAWDDRISAINEALIEKGYIRAVKITLIGRPGKIVDRGSCIVTMMEESKTPALPKGLPNPTSAPVKYAVYIASKQWQKVAEAIKDPEDVLIVEGFPKTDAQVSAIAVFTTNVTTKKLQAGKRQEKGR